MGRPTQSEEQLAAQLLQKTKEFEQRRKEQKERQKLLDEYELVRYEQLKAAALARAVARANAAASAPSPGPALMRAGGNAACKAAGEPLATIGAKVVGAGASHLRPTQHTPAEMTTERVPYEFHSYCHGRDNPPSEPPR